MKKGFTLIEVLVVAAIVGILLTIVLKEFRDEIRKDANYEICNLNDCYYVESYTKESNCIFMSEIEIRTCGNYTIKKLIE